MRRVAKSPREPPELLAYRKTGGRSYEDFPRKDTLRQALVEDQGALCYYCMRRIAGDVDRMKIEHLRSQARHPEEQLAWQNLLGSCRGNEGKPRSQQTCDTRKADDDLTIDPLGQNVEGLRYPPDGRVTSNDPELQADLDETLNLNCETLKRQRVAALEALKATLEKKLGGGKRWPRRKLEAELARLQDKPHLEFLGLFEYWLRVKIAQRSV